MKCVLLAGGRGTRIAEESQLRPKPMVEIGGMPILWHIMKGYASHGVTDFVVCLGYRGYQIKEYFANYFLHTSDVTVDLRQNAIELHSSRAEPWRITLVDTGESTLTAGRLLRIREHVADEPFLLTYGDGVGDVDVSSQMAFHAGHDMSVTMTVVPAPDPFGRTVIAGERIEAFAEKAGSGNLINAGFFVVDPDALDAIDGDEPWEQGPLRRLTGERQIAAWRHGGFWQCMDTLRDRELLEELWAGGHPPWKTW